MLYRQNHNPGTLETYLTASVRKISDGKPYSSGNLVFGIRLHQPGNSDHLKWAEFPTYGWSNTPSVYALATHVAMGVWVFDTRNLDISGRYGAYVELLWASDIQNPSTTTVIATNLVSEFLVNDLITDKVDDVPGLVWDIARSSHTDVGSFGETVKLTADGLGADAITSAKIADDAIGSDQLAANAIGSDQLAANAIGSDQLADDCITSAKIADDAITVDQLADDCITSAQLATGSLTADALATDAVTEIASGVDTTLTAAHGSGSWKSDRPDDGINTVTIQTQEASTNPILNVDIEVYDSTNTTRIGRTSSGSSGSVDVNLDNGTYQLRVRKDKVSFAATTEISVSGDATETIVGVVEQVGVPGSATTCAVYGTLLDAGGDPIVGETIQANNVVPANVDGNMMGNQTESATTDASGFFQLDLIRGTEVWIQSTEANIRARYTIPDQASVAFASLTANT